MPAPSGVVALSREYTMSQPLKRSFQNGLNKVSGSESDNWGVTIIGTKSCAKHHEEQSGRDATLKQQSGPAGVSEHNVTVFTLTAIGKPHTSSEC